MKVKYKIRLISISVLCALVALFCALSLFSRPVTAETPVYNATYDLGETITVTDQTVETPSGEKTGEAFVVFPDGTRQKAEKRLTLSQVGLYTLEYRAQSEGTVYKKEYQFSVYYPMHNVTDSLDTVSYTEADKYGIEGVSVSLSSGSTYEYASVIDLSTIRVGEPLVSLCITPETIGNESSAEAKILYVRVEDALDENNYFLIRLRPYSSYANATARKLVTVTARACTQTQWVGAEKGKKNANMHVNNNYGYYSKGSFYGFGLEEGSTPRVISLGYDNQTQTVFCYSPNGSTYGDYVTDFKNTKYYTSTWEGFKSDKVKLSLYAGSYVASAFRFNITEIAGCDLSEKYLTNLRASDIQVDYGDYTEETYPNAVVGKPYKIFPSTLPITYTQTKSFVNVYTGYESNMKTDVNVVNGCFTPQWATEHTIEYTYVDAFGNESVKTVLVNAKVESEQIEMTVDTTPLSLEVGSYVTLPAVTQLSGGDGKVNVRVYLYKGNAATELTGKTMHRLLQTGEYKLVYEATDYNGQTLKKEISVTATASTAPMFENAPVFAKYYLLGGKYSVPTWRGEDFSSGALQTVSTSATVSVDGTPVSVSDGMFTVPQGEKITFVYNVIDGNGKTNSVTMERPILDVGLNGELKMDKYFVATNGSVTAQDKGLLLAANTAAESAEFEFIREINASNFNAVLVFPQTSSDFSSATISFTEYADATKRVEITFVNKSNKIGVSVNGGTVYETNYAFASSTTNVKIELIGRKLSVGNKALTIEEYADGTAFTGFSFAWFAVSLKDVTNATAIEFISISNQSLSNTTADTIEPTIYMTTDFGGERLLNSEFVMNASYALDVLNPYATLTVSVKKGSTYLKDKNTGELLQNVTAEKAYTIALNEFGTYTFLFEYSDGASTPNESSFRYVVSVKDLQAPTISVSKTEISGEVNEDISLPSYAVSDNYSAEGKLSVFVQVISEKGIYQELENNKVFKPTESGKYTVRFWVLDQNNNYAYVDIVCRVS